MVAKTVRICRWWAGGAAAGFPDADPLGNFSTQRLASDSKQPAYDLGAAVSLESPDPSSQLGKVKMGQVIDQSDDSEITNPNPAIEELGLQNYFICCLGPPLQDHTPTTAQWVGLFYRVCPAEGLGLRGLPGLDAVRRHRGEGEEVHCLEGDGLRGAPSD